MSDPTDSDTLGFTRNWLRERVDAGETCPCCGQLAKVYRRTINSGMAFSLIQMYRLGKGPEFNWLHLPTQVGARSREEGKLAYWGLVEESTEPRDDGGRSGWWRVTPKGQAFVLQRTRVQKYARVYNGRCLNLTGESISIRDALGAKFNYEQLMSNQ